MIFLYAVVYSFQQVEGAVDGKLVGEFKSLFFVPVECVEYDLFFIQRFDAGIGRKGYRGIENGPAEQVAVRTYIRAATGQANA